MEAGMNRRTILSAGLALAGTALLGDGAEANSKR